MTAVEDGVRRATRDLNFAARRDRVVGFYVRRRALALAAQNPGWDADQFAVSLLGERAVIMGYLTQKLTALIKGPDSVTPSHLDLAAQAQALAGTGGFGAALSKSIQSIYLTSRGDWIWQIVWRAMAIHASDLWKSAVSPWEIETAALDELVDRRLRAVERMTCTVNAGRPVADRSWQPITSVNGPWKDGATVRVVEYPWLPKGPFTAILPQMTDWQVVGENLLYKPAGNSAPLHVPASIAASWSARVTPGGTLWVPFKPGAAAPSDVIRKMFEIPRDDFLNRSWLFCDMVGAALSIEALWLGLARRNQAPAFDAVMNKPGYVGLGPVVQFTGQNDIGILMNDSPADNYFENLQIDMADLQVGDFVLFWNSRIYGLLTHGAWGNEFSLIMGVDSDPASGQVITGGDGPQVWLAGHGMDTSRYSAMATELAGQLKDLLDTSRTAVASAVAANPGATVAGPFIKWSPYEDFQAPGAWWLMITQAAWKDDWAYPSKDAAVQGVPRAVADDPAGGTGYHHPPDPGAIYFPLWEPRVPRAAGDPDSWHAYLRLRRADASYRPPAALADVQADGSLAAGLFYRGTTAKIPVVRPRIRK